MAEAEVVRQPSEAERVLALLLAHDRETAFNEGVKRALEGVFDGKTTEELNNNADKKVLVTQTWAMKELMFLMLRAGVSFKRLTSSESKACVVAAVFDSDEKLKEFEALTDYARTRLING